MNFNYYSSMLGKSQILLRRELQKAEETEEEQNNTENNAGTNSQETSSQNAIPTASKGVMPSAEYVRLMAELAAKEKEASAGNTPSTSEQTTTPETVVAADNTTEQTDETETALPKALERAIESDLWIP